MSLSASPPPPPTAPSGDGPPAGQNGAPAPGARIRYDRAWLNSVLRPLLVTLLIACINVALLSFLGRFIPERYAVYLQVVLAMGVFAALVGTTTTSWLGQPGQRLRRTGGYRAAELGLLLAAARLLLWLLSGGWPTLRSLVTEPLTTLLDAPFLLTSALIALSWIMASEMTSDLLEMALQPDELYAVDATGETVRDTSRAANTDRRLLLASFTGRWVTGGLILVLLSAAARIGPAENGLFAITRQNIDPTVISAVLIYFLAGLLLISQAQMAILRARWTLDRAQSAESIFRNWPFYVLVLVLLIGALALALPLGGTFYLSQVLLFIVNAIYLLLYGLMQLFMFLVAALLGLFPGAESPPPPMPTPEPPAFEPPPAPPEALVFAGSALFWMIAALLLGYAAFVYFSGKGVRFGWLAWLWAMLRLRGRQTWLAVRSWRPDTADAVSAYPAALRRRRLRRRGLNPAQLIRYYYLTTLDRAQESGVPRDSAETPYHYAPRLAAHLPPAASSPHPPAEQPVPHEQGSEHGAERAHGEDDEEVRALTDAFVAVRYAADAPTPAQAARLEAIWQHLRDRLRRRI